MITEEQYKFLNRTRYIFENYATGLSKNENSQCYYNHDLNKTGCAVGCHLPREVAAEWDKSGKNLDTLLRENPDIHRDSLMGMDLAFLCMVRHAHDTARDVDGFIYFLNTLIYAYTYIVSRDGKGVLG